MEAKPEKTTRCRVPVERCGHVRLRRAGIQRMPVAPYRIHLVHCEDCHTTLSTRTLRTAVPGRVRPEAARPSAA